MSQFDNKTSPNSHAPSAPGHASYPASGSGTNAASESPIIQIQPPSTADLQPSYTKIVAPEIANDEHGWYGNMINTLGNCIGLVGAVPCCVCLPNPYRNVGQGQVGLITKFGRFYKAVDPGLVKVNPLSEKLHTVDVRIQMCVPQQVCMTKDNVTLQLTSVIYYHIIAPHIAAFGVADVRHALVERTQTTLRHVIGARVLQDVIERREEIAQSISEIIEEVAAGWGVRVESMLMKDIVFSRELQDSLSMAAQSKRIGESKVIAARAEVESAKLMRQAADILSSSAAMQIRYLEAMQAMAKSANSKVIFLPPASQNMGETLLKANQFGEGSSNHMSSGSATVGGDSNGMNEAYKAYITEHM